MQMFLKEAIKMANASVAKGGFPAGAVIVKDNEIIGKGISIGNKLNDPTSHGEIAAIRNACKNLKTDTLNGATLYASMEPCIMCLSAIMWSSIDSVVFACSKDVVAKEYYGGDYKSNSINKKFINNIELRHVKDLERRSLSIVEEWKSHHVT